MEAIEDIAAAHEVCRVRDLAERFGVSHVTVVRIIKRLQGEGYVLTAPYKPVELTPKGRRLAKASRERHDVVYRFLLALGISETIAAIDSEGIEHHVSSETLARFREIADAGGV